jgi:hypothetical protein
MTNKYTKTYQLSGVVWGNCWGGGKVGYKSEIIEGKNKKQLIAKANKMLKDGSLDSGMGYESLTGAYLTLTTTTETELKGKSFINTEEDEVIIGELSDKELDVSY